MTKADIQLVRAWPTNAAARSTDFSSPRGETFIGELRASHSLRTQDIPRWKGFSTGPRSRPSPLRDMERLSLLKTPSNSLALVEIPAAT